MIEERECERKYWRGTVPVDMLGETFWMWILYQKVRRMARRQPRNETLVLRQESEKTEKRKIECGGQREMTWDNGRYIKTI